MWCHNYTLSPIATRILLNNFVCVHCIGCLFKVCSETRTVRMFVIVPINLCFKRTMPDHITEVPSEKDENPHAVEPPNHETTITELIQNKKCDSSYLMLCNAFSIDPQLLCFSGEINMTNFNIAVKQDCNCAVEETRFDITYRSELVSGSGKKIPATADCESCKLSYIVSVGNTVKTYNTKIFASLPQQNKYMVKQRVRDTSGATRIKLVLKSSHERLTV